KAYVGIDSKNVENMIAALETSRKNAESELEEAQQIRKQAETLQQDLSTAWKKFEGKRDQLYKKAEDKAAQAIKNAREEAELIIDEVRRMKDKALFKEHEWIEAKKLLDE